MPREPGFEQELCAEMKGFSLHAAVRCEADDRQGLERLCRYITRPELAYDRVQCTAAGRVVLKLKTPWRDGTTHLVMSPLEFMQRLGMSAIRPSGCVRPAVWWFPDCRRGLITNGRYYWSGAAAVGRQRQFDRLTSGHSISL